MVMVCKGHYLFIESAAAVRVMMLADGEKGRKQKNRGGVTGK